MVILKSKRFILRPIKVSDTGDFLEMFRDKESRSGFMVFPKNIHAAKRSIRKNIHSMKKAKPTSETFAIIINNEFAGFIEIHNLNKKFQEHQATIGYCLAKKFRNQGIATEAVIMLTNYAFKKYKLKRIDGWCRSFNKASAKVLENAGYKLEGVLRKNKFKDGKYFDDMVWAKIK